MAALSDGTEPADGLFGRIDHRPAYQRVAEAIEREIMSGRLAPGAPIGTEADLVRQFGVNRSTVREGIRMLEQSGLIQRDGSRRLFASLPRYTKLASRISRALVLHQVTFRELWEATMAIEPMSAELACTHARPEVLDAIAGNLERSRRAVGDPALLAELDTEFHALIGRASGNRVIELSREPLGLLFQPTSHMLAEEVPVAPARMIEAHTRVFEAIRAGDVAEAGAWMRRHVHDFRRGFERLGKDLEQPVERLFHDHVSARTPPPAGR
ncbi:FadR/GntR family transcriptional regulator [Azospirillum halopraeferens]|uniref:FadR/GntR family transcriptional regulator n=1 Tax=Azospirillum halopraeferens TaxID=34010 RepID=UPI00040BA023|nr:FCD domain-containing protein [Azospirillum halopraeferens]